MLPKYVQQFITLYNVHEDWLFHLNAVKNIEILKEHREFQPYDYRQLGTMQKNKVHLRGFCRNPKKIKMCVVYKCHQTFNAYIITY